MSSDVIAINIALLPDQTMAAEAKRINARLLENYPEGFALDATHTPHITLLQAFIRRQSLEEVYRGVKAIDVSGELEAEGFDFHARGTLGVGGFVVSRPPWLLEAHRQVVAAVAPLSVSEGDADAFMTLPGEAPVSDATVDYVKSYIPSRTGDNYHPHLSVGIARTDFLNKLKRTGVRKFRFGNEGPAVYQLGNFGTCRELLFRSA